jgi:hypothetical protein
MKREIVDMNINIACFLFICMNDFELSLTFRSLAKVALDPPNSQTPLKLRN